MTHQLGTHSSPQGIPGGAVCKGTWRGLIWTLKDIWGVDMKSKECLGRGHSGNRSVEAEVWRTGSLDEWQEGPLGPQENVPLA